MEKSKTIVLTGVANRIGESAIRSFLLRGYNVVATSKLRTLHDTLNPSGRLVLVHGDINQMNIAQVIVDSALRIFGSIDALVNIDTFLLKKSVINGSTSEFKNGILQKFDGFAYLCQLAACQMLKQEYGGNVFNISDANILGYRYDEPGWSPPMSAKGHGDLDAKIDRITELISGIIEL